MCYHQRQLMPEPKTRLKVRKPYPLDADGKKIRPDKENQKTGQKQKKSK